MQPYRFLPHTADVRLWVQADRPEMLFARAMEAMTEYLQPGFCRSRQQGTKASFHLYTESVDMTALLIDFLNDVLTLSHAHKVLFCQVDFTALNAEALEARVSGYAVDAFEEDIKAVTYHEAEIVHTKEGRLETMIIFDI